MAFTVMNNPSAMMSLGELNKNINNANRNQKKLATGVKINSAGDDASAYAISERMRSHLRALNQDVDNVKNGRAMLSVAAGGIDSIVQELRNLKELAIKSANDSNTDKDRETIQKEFEQKMANIDDIATETNYNGKFLLDGRYGRKEVPVQTSTWTENVTRTEENYTLINPGDYTITSVGVYMLARGYTGTVTIADGVSDVKIKQQDPSTACVNAYIVGPSTGNANLWLDGLNIKNTTDKSTVKFQGSDNVLTLKGTNKIVTQNPDTTDPWRKAVIHVGGGGTVQSNSGGTLDMLIDRSGFDRDEAEIDGHVGIGTDVGERDGDVDIMLYNANITMKSNVVPVRDDYGVVSVVGVYSAMVGASYDGEVGDITVYGGRIHIETIGTGIGAGVNAKANDIVINGGADLNVTASGGAAIGSGWTFAGPSKVNDIYIDNATIDAFAEDGGAGIGSGCDGIPGVRDIYIGNSANVIASGNGTAGTSSAADIGAGQAGRVRNIIIGTSANITVEDIGEADTGTMTGTITYQDLNLNPAVNAPNVIEPDSGTTTTTDTVTHTQTTGGMKGDPLIIHHGPKANQALHCYINDMHTDAMGLFGTQVVTREAAQWALSDDSTDPPRVGAIDQAINYALNEATTVGAYISRLETTEDNLVISSENAQASESTIRDADMAKEMTEFTKNNVLAQASQSMLAQANQNSSSVLSLLQ